MFWTSRQCPVCGSAERKFLFRDRNRREGYSVETDLVSCLGCGMRYLDPVPSSDGWLQEYSTIHTMALRRRGRASSLLARIAEYGFARWVTLWSVNRHWHEAPHEMGGGRKLLDIGCGTGAKLQAFKQRGFDIYGIDVSPVAIAEACARLDGDFRVGAFETADYLPNSFDVIRFDNVLEHVYKPRAFMKKVYALLKPRGVAYGYVPNGTGPTMTFMRRYSINSWVPFHVNLFTPGSLDRLASEVGFRVRVAQVAHPEWAVASVKQWANRRRLSFNEKSWSWWDRLLLIVLSPVWWLMTVVWQGEELVLEARK